MKAKKSNLELVKFVVFESELSIVQPSNDQNTAPSFDKYEIDIDFSKSRENRSKNEYLFIIYLKAKVNSTEEPQVGYKLLVNTAALFEIKNPNTIDKTELNNLENISALSITISSLRNFISTLTSFGPFGSYTLPAINVGELINEKIKTQRKAKSTKRASDDR